MVSVVVCDDHRLFGESFAVALGGAGAGVAVTAHPEETIATLNTASVDRVVMSLLFPQGRGLAAVRHIRGAWPQTHVYCIGANEPQLRRAAIDTGAHAVLSKTQPLSELIQTVLHVSRATNSYTGPLADAPLHSPAEIPTDKQYPLAAQFLTGRERDVLGLLVSARSTARIAEELGISLTTARGYVQSILVKLGVHSRVEAVAYAVQHSVVQIPARK